MSNPANPSRPRTPIASPIPPSTAEQPPLPDQQQDNDIKSLQRKSSFSFLRRGKSVEKMNGMKRTVSNGKLQKKSKPNARDSIALPSQPPKIPDLATQPKLQDFGGAEFLGNRSQYNVPVPKVPSGIGAPHSRSESMAHRGRHSYAGSTTSTLNNPRRVRRRKDPIPFNILVVGARNSGKSSFGEFLRASLALPARKQRQSHYRQDSVTAPPAQNDSHFQSEYLETDIAGERIGLTIWDSEGLEKNIVDLQLREIVAFIESKFTETLTEESKVNRTPGSKDPHIHCVVLLLDPSNLNKTVGESWKRQETAINGDLANGKSFLADVSPEAIDALNESMDLQVLRALQGKTTVVPVISKADTVTSERMSFLKRSVFQQLRASKLDPFEVLGMEEEEQYTNSDSDLDEIPVGPNHKRLDEADEDRYRARVHDGTNLQLDSESSSSSSVVYHQAESAPPKQQGSAAPPLPLSVLTPDPIAVHEPVIGATSRDFPWGSADPYDPTHCDFVRFKEAIFEEWFMELREASRELWYEGWRTSRLNNPRAKSAASGAPHREATVPTLSPESKRYLAVTSPSVDGRSSSRNVSGGHGPSPQASQQFRMTPSPSNYSTSPRPSSSQGPRSFSRQSQRASPQPPAGFHQQAAHQQAQQLFQQSPQQTNPQQDAARTGSTDVGVAR